MIFKRQSIALTVFGAVTIASGAFRFFFQPGGEKGLVFGLVTGCMGLVAGRLVRGPKVLQGLALGAVSMAFVVGWFCWESFVIKGFANAELRQLIVIAVTLACAVMVYRPRR